MLDILILSKDQKLYQEDGSVMWSKPLVIRNNGQYKVLQDAGPFGDVDGVRFLLCQRFCSYELARNSRIEAAVVYYLQTYQLKQDMSFDCYAFVNLVHGIGAHKFSKQQHFWNTWLYNGHVIVGDVVFLVTPPKKGNQGDFHHAAVYIGHGFYLSVYGAGGDLEVSTLGQMMSDYQAKRILVAVPRIRRL